MDSKDYTRALKLMEIDTAKNVTMKRNFKRPPYCIGDARKKWEECQKTKSKDITE